MEPGEMLLLTPVAALPDRQQSGAVGSPHASWLKPWCLLLATQVKSQKSGGVVGWLVGRCGCSNSAFLCSWQSGRPLKKWLP